MDVKTAAAALVLAVVSAVLADNSSASGNGPEPNPSRAALDTWLGHIPGSKDGKVAPVDDAAIRTVFPGEHFYTVRFMRYPRAQLPPDPLRLDNLIRVKPDGSVERIEDLAGLTKWLKKHLPPIQDEVHAREAMLAGLRLAEEFHQDGGYQFDVPEQSVMVTHQGDHVVASGKAVVTEGGKGEITLTLTVDASGKLIAVEPGGHVRPDVRLR